MQEEKGMINKKMVFSIVGIFALLFITVLYVVYHSRYNAFYYNDRILFVGEYIKYWTFEYDTIEVELRETNNDDNAVIKRQKPILINIHDSTYRAIELTPEIIDKHGGERQETSGPISTWRIFSPTGRNPSYTFSCDFINNKILSFSFGIHNPQDPNMGEPKLPPISFSLTATAKIVFPVNKKRIEDIFGTPDKFVRYLKWP